MRGKLRVAVLMGGKSAEYQISLQSGKQVVLNLNPNKYTVLPIIISRNGRSYKLNNKKYPLSQLSNVNCQMFFIAMHGPCGEDGTIQGLLELISIPYTGSGVLASALGMSTSYSRKLFTQAGLRVPDFLVLKKGDSLKVVWQKFKPPVFVKPYNQGSSIGGSIAKRKKDLSKALNLAWKYSNVAIVEEFIDGIEVTGSIIGNSKPKALPLVEIVPKTPFFDFQAKYNERLCDEIIPARISKSLTQKAQDAALKAYQILGCRGFGRVDMILKEKDIYVLEVNTIPGLTPVSLFPKSAAAAGISYPQLLDKIIEFVTP